MYDPDVKQCIKFKKKETKKKSKKCKLKEIKILKTSKVTPQHKTQN